MSVRSEGREVVKKWQHVVELLRETGGDLKGQRGKRGSTPKETIQPIPSTRSLREEKGSSDLQRGRDLQLKLTFFYKPAGGVLTERL